MPGYDVINTSKNLCIIVGVVRQHFQVLETAISECVILAVKKADVKVNRFNVTFRPYFSTSFHSIVGGLNLKAASSQMITWRKVVDI